MYNIKSCSSIDIDLLLISKVFKAENSKQNDFHWCYASLKKDNKQTKNLPHLDCRCCSRSPVQLQVRDSPKFCLL